MMPFIKRLLLNVGANVFLGEKVSEQTDRLNQAFVDMSGYSREELIGGIEETIELERAVLAEEFNKLSAMRRRIERFADLRLIFERFLLSLARERGWVIIFLFIQTDNLQASSSFRRQKSVCALRPGMAP